MLRRILNSVIETTLQNNAESVSYPSPFAIKETVNFGWLVNAAPCFPINANNIKIITEPNQFYETIIEHCKSATKRITLVSLYIGNGELEKKIVSTLRSNEFLRRNELKINILLDYTRGSRFENNSRTLLLPLLQENNENCNVSLYHTPALRGIIKKVTPDRFNELFGLQHMKLYIFDDTLVISGANLSNDYFTNRQDRYYVIEDKHLTNFYSGLVDKVQKFSLKMDKNNNLTLCNGWNCSPYQGDKNKFIQTAGDTIEQYLEETKIEQNSHKKDGHDTWVFPSVQMGQLGINQDAVVTERILSEAVNGSKLQIASGYFNLTSEYMNTLIEHSRAKCNVLMAHPEANGFLGANGLAGGIPYAYSLIADQFEKKLDSRGQAHRIKLYEYLKKGWTYHAKGLWYYPPEREYPCLTLIGSPNFGERSVKKDLETQLVIVTENEDLQKRFHEECTRLYRLGLPAETGRKVPKWVYAFVTLFRSYF